MRRKLTVFKYLIVLLILACSGAIIVGSAVYLYLNPKLPPIDVLREANLQIPLRIYSQNGELIGVYGEKFRTPVKMEDVPQHFVRAILAAEDDRFLQHRGVDLAGLLRAALELLRSGKIKTGGSTITMQVARNFFLSSEQTFVRKFNEIFLALKIERLLSKDEILELYVNKIFLGKRAYGVQAAAAIYYGKDIADLSVAQLAMIAGLPKAPSVFNPVANPERALIRRNWILGRMHKLNYIDEETWQTAVQAPVSASYYGPRLQLDAGYAAELARAEAFAKYGDTAYADGLKVITTIDANKQRSAEKAVVRGLEEYTARHGYRGPEQRLGKVDREQGLAVVRDLVEVRGMLPALVEKIGGMSTSADGNGPSQSLQLLLDDGQSTTINWQPESNPLQIFIDENRRGKPITDLAQLFAAGDIIRIRYAADASAEITQLPVATSSLIALRPFNGAITAVVGGYDFQQSNFNRATQAYRQPGSNFKPFIYAAAFAAGYTPASLINDAPIVFNDDKLETAWRPENASGKFYGPTTLRRALYLSRNLVSVRLLREMGIDQAIRYLRRFNFSAGPLPRDLSLALGSYSMTPLEVARLYASIANGGYRIEPYIVSEIRDRDDQLLFAANPVLACEACAETSVDEALAGETAEALADETTKGELEHEEADSLDELIAAIDAEPETPIDAEPVAPIDAEPKTPTDAETAALIESEPEAPAPPPRYAERIIDERVAFILDSILQDVITRGTGTRAQVLKRSDLAGKTGTTNGPTDAWFSGYHPELVATTWLGFDDNQLLGRREFGGSAALPIWITFMAGALEDVPTAVRQQPAGLKAVKIDRITGLAPTATTTQTLFEKFREEYAPAVIEPGAGLPAATQTELHEELF